MVAIWMGWLRLLAWIEQARLELFIAVLDNNFLSIAELLTGLYATYTKGNFDRISSSEFVDLSISIYYSKEAERRK